MARIVINLLSGSSLEGQRWEFDDDAVTLGRHPGNDVAFNPEKDRLVSSRHARITIEGDEVWIEDLGSSNGSYQNGRRFEGRVRLRLGDEVVLGKKGAVLTVYSPVMGDESGRIADTGRIDAPRPKRRTTFGRSRIGRDTLMNIVADVTQRERGRSRRLLFAAAGMMLLVLIAVIWILVWFTRGGADDIVRDAARREAEETARDTAAETARDTARGVAVRTAEERVGELSRTFDERLAAAGRTFQDVFPVIEKSVYPVFVRRRSGGTERMQAGGGTCWVVAPGVLATNAHVAEQHRPPRARLVVRTADPVRDLEVESIEIHPGYDRWRRLMKEYQPIDPGGSKFIRFVPACDVALLRVRDEDKKALGDPLPLVKDEELGGISRGTPAAFIGYPVEGTVVGALERSEATSDVGPVSQVLDFFLEKNEAGRERLVSYNFKAEGGASGSPVFGLDGRVLAVHSAGNFKFLAGQRISQGSTAFGQRADLLRELLEGRAAAATDRLEPAWRERLLALWKMVRDPEATMSAFRERLSFTGTSRVGRRRIGRGTLAPGERLSFTFDPGTARGFVAAAMVTGDEFGRLALEGSIRTKPESWLSLGQGRRAGSQTLDVVRPRESGGELSFELWIFFGS